MTDKPGRAPEDQWWTINGADLMEVLRRAHSGEDPDLLYLEMIANSEITEPGS